MTHTATTTQYVEVTTASGRLKGRLEGIVTVFKGIPYAEPPVGPLRFQTPRPVKPWQGTRDALQFGMVAIQRPFPPDFFPMGPFPTAMSEDCLTLNIWSPTGAERRPVIVWIHGGGYRTGASSLPVYDGTQFAEIGKVVLVSINYRLGVLGWAAHRDLQTSDGGACANWAIQDQMQALRWIKENIAAFGGDPERITVMGQSGGAINAVMMAHSAVGRSLFHQIICMGTPYICPPATLDREDWSTAVEALATELGTSVVGLREVAATQLHEAELRQYGSWQSAGLQRALTADTGRRYRGTVVDGRVLDEWPAFYTLPNIPTIIGCVRTEGASFYEFRDPSGKRLAASLPAPDDAAASAAVQRQLDSLYYLDKQSPTAHDLIAHYRACAGREGRRQDNAALLMDLFGDMLVRHFTVRKAEEAANAGAKNLYVYEYAVPLPAPNHDTPHAWELPVTFGTHRNPILSPMVGNGALQNEVSNAMIQSFSAFAESGRPTSSALPPWPDFNPRGANVQVFGDEGVPAKLQQLRRYDQLSALDALAAMRPG